MKKIIKILSIIACILLLCIACKEKEQDDIHIGISYISYTDIIESTTNTYVKIGDSIYNFNYISGYYGKRTSNNNDFCFRFKDSINCFWHSIEFDIFTKTVEPEVFFQKGIFKFDTMYIWNTGFSIPMLDYRTDYYGSNYAILTWNTVFYADRKFTGKGTLEIMDTLYTNYPDTYYPPQKIEFEFK